ncbi:hypothetical protein J41TS12_10730 [Paenibacillus antibioticophila]|uniref:Uncharacterized protein n=1 Tax=Paenibacillus antibioticophila TaxID=1274374 RepID=A0A919XND2_9BACL|nr:hypothetical protein [Paenibacillus antibioticophila]GIO36212.1 hypothetical protein J41TS12_10730 [Paenibacillus antibioticophila]
MSDKGGIEFEIPLIPSEDELRQMRKEQTREKLRLISTPSFSGLIAAIKLDEEIQFFVTKMKNEWSLLGIEFDGHGFIERIKQLASTTSHSTETVFTSEKDRENERLEKYRESLK